jgi:hypothetical protein
LKRVAARCGADLRLGGTQPKCGAYCDDENVYVLKVPHDPIGSKERLNELVASAVAEAVGIKVPESAVIEVKNGILTTYRGLVPAGEYFGSLFLPDYHALPDDGSRNAEFADELYPLLAFDLLIYNPDRKPGDILVEQRATIDLTAIDNGNAFTGSHWTSAHVDRNRTGIIDGPATWVFRDLRDEAAARAAARSLTSRASNLSVAVDRVAALVEIDRDERETIERFMEARVIDLEALAARQVGRRV